ncbi:MAG: phenylalanine--tRNA ligase subunit alpha [Chitinophagales bacterium]
MNAVFQQAETLHEKIKNEVIQDAEAFRIQYLGSKGEIKAMFSAMKDLEPQERKAFGQLMNALKVTAEARLKEAQGDQGSNGKGVEKRDYTTPGITHKFGTRHPIEQTKDRMIEIFAKLGFSIAEGPEIEDDWHNFTALNLPQDHPARDMQDTFYVDSKANILLRTHTSAAQIRVMENEKPPIRVITPGRVFRNETISARAHCAFHQVEGLYIAEKVSFADLKQTLYYFAKEMFGSDNIRLRPSYFPFTEPSAELDVSCFICDTKGCPVCKGSGWVEIGGCGMVDPEVLKSVNIEHPKYTGFAFGMGIERIAMLVHGIDDLRLFFENDQRFLQQF